MTRAVALAARGLTRSFGELRAVDALDLEIHEGELFGFLGPNGAGKTTTIRMMAGLLRPTAGHVAVLGREITTSDPSARRLVGLCPQENVLYPHLTAHENLAYVGALYGLPRAKRAARADELLDRLGLAEKRDARAGQLSGGMKRRLTLVMALVHDPPVVVFDEPEAGLDPQTRVLVRGFLRSLQGERTVVLTSHNMDEVERLAGRIAIIDHGRLIRLGTSTELKAELGDADTLEVAVAAGEVQKAGDALRAQGLGEPLVEGGTVLLRGRGLSRRVPEVVQALERAGAHVIDLRYRGATLEDVFIQVTGRRLRE